MITLTREQTLAQSLDTGLPGHVLVAVEHAVREVCPRDEVRQLLRGIAAAPVDASPHAGLFYGAPAVAFVLHAASTSGQLRATTTAAALHAHVRRIVHQKLEVAGVKERAGQPLTFRDFDLFYGLTGLGLLLLRTAPEDDALDRVLRYISHLALTRESHPQAVPGWWVAHDPDAVAPTPGGHANLGMAHGAAGMLALLGLAWRRGIHVQGHEDAIDALHGWFDRWRQDGPEGAWWPEWVTRDDLRTGRSAQRIAGRPSWCYGAIGIARAQQIAAIATGDQRRRAQAEATIADCLTTEQLGRLTHPGLCHGIAGLYQTAFRAAADANDPHVSHRLPLAAAALMRHPSADFTNDALLDGRAGHDLALLTHHTGEPPASEWDTCLLIT